MLISIDHGNKQIKTNRRTFVAGLIPDRLSDKTSCTTTANITPYPSSVFRI